MKRYPIRALVCTMCLSALAVMAPAAQGPAGATGACHHVLGPVDATGAPIGFTCENVGNSALLVWNASQISSNITIIGGVRAVNFNPGNFSINGSFVSDGPLAFIGGQITVNGSITGSSVLIAGFSSSENDLRTNLLGPSGRITGTVASDVIVSQTGKVTATNGNVVMTGFNISNAGQLTAQNGIVMLRVGTTMDIGWNDVVWIAGVNAAGSAGPGIINTGTITAANIVMEAHRDNSVLSSLTTTLRNRGTLKATDTVTFVTGVPGVKAGAQYVSGSFGVSNEGTIYATKVTISPYFVAAPGGAPTDATFDINDVAQRQQLQASIAGTILVPSTDNTPTSASAPVIDAGRTFTVTSNVMVPQLAPSLTNLNATPTHVNATAKAAMLALSSGGNGSEQIRGDGTQLTPKKPKSRTKAKPVLIRGAFFGSKISAVISSNP